MKKTPFEIVRDHVVFPAVGTAIALAVLYLVNLPPVFAREVIRDQFGELWLLSALLFNALQWADQKWSAPKAPET